MVQKLVKKLSRTSESRLTRGGTVRISPAEHGKNEKLRKQLRIAAYRRAKERQQESQAA